MVTRSKNDEFGPFLTLAKTAATSAGELLVEKMGAVTVSEKNPGDFVTQADIESQRLIQEMIKREFPEHSFLGEESDASMNAISAKDEYCWIVDPLDGTTNYIHKLRSFAVSIALKKRGEIVAGCVLDPILDEMYCAVLGGGATLNNSPVVASTVKSSEQALLAVSLPSRLERESSELRRLTNVLVDSGATVRRLGSAALNLCYVACGRLDGYWSTSAKIWDLAAGTLILTEAGATIRNIDGRPFDWNDPQFIATASNELFEDLRSCFLVE